MELRAGADLEVLAQEHAVRAHGHAALAPVNGIALVGVDERASARTTPARSVLVSCSAAGGGGKTKGNKKKPSATPNAGAEHAAGKENGKRPEHDAFRELPVGRALYARPRRCITSMRSLPRM